MKMNDVLHHLGPTTKRSEAHPVVKHGPDPLITRYMTEVNRYALLSRDQENDLARQYQATREMTFAHRLVSANLRFVVKIAHEFHGYDVPLLDLVQEGNLGLMIAIKKFDPTRGYRLVSYAVWWIRAYMRAYALKSWSLVRIGTTQAQRKLFFSLRAARGRAEAAAAAGQVITNADLARELSVKETDLADMDVRLAGHDISLEAQVGDDGRWSPIDRLPSPRPDPEERLAEKEAAVLVRRSIQNLVPITTVKERYVLEHRFLTDGDRTLQNIGDHLNVSRERVRQIEGKVLNKMEASLRRIEAHQAA